MKICGVLREQVQESGKRDQSIIITGDFNCKLGKEIERNGKGVYQKVEESR